MKRTVFSFCALGDAAHGAVNWDDALWRDYITTGFVGGVNDATHRQRFGSALKKLKECPGAPLADKAEAYFLKIGFTKDDVSCLRERLLEP